MCKSHRSNQSTRCHSVEQRFDFLHHIRLVGFEREDVARLEIPQLLTLLEVLLAAARDIEHDGGVLLDFTRVHGIDERRQRNAALVEAALFFYKSGYVYNGKYEPSRERVHTEGPEYGAECIAALERYIQRDYLMRRIMLDYSPRRRTLRHANTYSAEKKVAGVLKREIDTEDRSEAEFEALRRTIEGK